MRAGELWVDTGGGLVILVGVVDAAEFCLCDPDKVIDRSILGLQAPCFFKLLQRLLVFFLVKQLKATLERIGLSWRGQGENQAAPG